MSDTSISIVPRVKDYPKRKEKAEEIVKWLIDLDVIKPELSACVGDNAERGYAPSEGARGVVVTNGKFFSGLTTCGLEVISEHTMFSGYMDKGTGSFGFSQSNLGFTFWNWPEFTDAFIQKFSKKLAFEIDVIVFRP